MLFAGPAFGVTEIDELVDRCTFAVRLEFPYSGDWNLEQMLDSPYLTGGTIQGNYLIVEDRELADFPQPDTRPVMKVPPIPSGIGLQFAVGSDNTIWVFTDAPLPQAYLALQAFRTWFGHASNLGIPWIGIADYPGLWDHGVPIGLELHEKLLGLSRVGYAIYYDLRTKGLLSQSFTFPEAVVQSSIAVLNRTGSTVSIMIANNQSDCLSRRTSDPVRAALVERWWPKGTADRCGNAEMGFTLNVEDPLTWATYNTASGDNGTTQVLSWDGATFVSNVHFGSREAYTLSPEPPLPQTVELKNYGVWSGNHTAIVVVAQTESITVSDLWENPQVGEPPQPTFLSLRAGWNGGVSAEMSLASLLNELLATGLPKGILNSLVKQLEGAITSLKDGKVKPFWNQMQALLHHVSALRGKAIDEETADWLTDSIRKIVNAFEAERAPSSD